jgi:arylformamidase
MNFKELYDISVSLTPGMAVWPGDPALDLQRFGEIEHGGVANITRINASAHTGTHMDAPVHFIDGATGIDQFPLDALVGTVYVLDFTHLDHHIGPDDLAAAGLPEGAERVLFKTTNSAIWQDSFTEFRRDYIALAPAGAQWLVDRGIKLVGIDYLSIEEFEPARPDTHYILLGKRVVVLEGVDLRQIEPGEYTIFALPVKIKDADGAPARVLLGRN